MPAVRWPLRNGRPMVQVVLALAPGGHPVTRNLLADSGAGSRFAAFELVLDEDDCLLCGGNPDRQVTLGGSYRGSFPLYVLRVRIPVLGFEDDVRAVGVRALPEGFDGIAGFQFLSRFSYGNFGDPNQFGLETLPTS